jgi:rRNA-processing protein FCF1
MLDTNVLDYIYDNDLSWQINWFIRNGNVSFYITYVQIAETEGIIALSSDSIIRKHSLIHTILAIDVKLIPMASSVAGTIKQSRRGYKVPQVGTFKVTSDNVAAELRKYQGSKNSNPIGRNEADLEILHTAIDEDMDFVVTNDKNMKKLLPKLRLKPTRLKVIDNNDLIGFLDSLPRD